MCSSVVCDIISFFFFLWMENINERSILGRTWCGRRVRGECNFLLLFDSNGDRACEKSYGYASRLTIVKTSTFDLEIRNKREDWQVFCRAFRQRGWFVGGVRGRSNDPAISTTKCQWVMSFSVHMAMIRWWLRIYWLLIDEVFRFWWLNVASRVEKICVLMRYLNKSCIGRTF